MRLIDADKLYPDRMTNKGNVAISQSQIAKAKTVDAIPLSVIDEIKAEIDSYYLDCDFSVYDKDENCKKCNDKVFDSIRNIIDRKIKEIQA